MDTSRSLSSVSWVEDILQDILHVYKDSNRGHYPGCLLGKNSHYLKSHLVLASDAALNEFIIKSRFGRPDFPITVDNITVLAIVGLSSITCSFVGQVWSKTAFAISLLRMCNGWKKAFVWFSIISMNVLFAFSSLSFWVGCVPLEKRWKPFADGTCYDLKWVVSFGIFVSVYSGLLDIALSIIPWLILMRPRPAEESSGLTLSKKEKIGVSVALSMGMLAGIAAFVKASYMRSVNDTTGDFSRKLRPLTYDRDSSNASYRWGSRVGRLGRG
ncbi:hypothetical protein HER10_EVM0003724 [Colletotrichum scovillei]|uniref:uncharacterized protein n=1 Tax=Colletotrichum scovillei TaxID=1209932 RepID=UPI0015C2E1E6|nr:uncharacterized protein HER10_EVM0003724 [Colletotrichum scovillei]KAF4777562.1 hypothetical protein HER10_EVM0003724 [Colletotrichum scovillei]